MSRRSRLARAALVALLGVAFGTAPARAEEGEAPRAFEVPDYVATGVLGITVLGSYLILRPAADGPRGGWLFDDDVRGALRVGSGDRRAVQVASDVGQYLLVAQPLVVDAGLVAWGLRAEPEVALHLALIDAQALLASLLLTNLTKNLLGRQRPYGDTCAPGACTSPSRWQSFVSGHSAASFTGAGLTCVHHRHLPLYGGGAPDVGACVGALGVASAVAVLRVASDDHFATDVLAGAAVGLLTGWLLPELLYYGTGAPDDAAASRARRGEGASGVTLIPLPELGADHLGLSLLVVY